MRRNQIYTDAPSANEPARLNTLPSRDKFILLFIARRSRKNPGLPYAMLYFRIKINSIVANERSTFVSVPCECWDSRQQRITDGDPDAKNKNALLLKIKTDLTKLFLRAQAQGERITAFQLLYQYVPASERVIVPKAATIDQVLTDYLAECHRDYDGRTRQFYETRVSHLRDFLSGLGILRNPIHALDLAHGQQFVNYCKAKKYDHQYIVRHVQVLKRIGSFAVINRYVPVNPFAELKLKKRERRDIRHLTRDQIDLLTTTAWPDTLQRVVDLFCFSIHTGLHYSDTQTLTAANMRPGVDGRLWLFKTRGKYADSRYFDNQPDQSVRLSPVALALLDKYGGIDRLPKLSNVHYNRHLKDIGQVIGFEGLTVKIARKTFTDLMLNDMGISVEAVAAMLGHASTKHVAHYGRASERRIAKEVQFEAPAPADPAPVAPRPFGIIPGDLHRTKTA